ncbi:transcriptional regulator [Streptomyces tanashiensis]|uniref:transcriptional regulator n=1 Tax=Streptomyces tanashiensis TaxID=67367 RepID=UPI0027E4D6D9|nr:transcriptional regulator [Streptomyces tanashiensis]
MPTETLACPNAGRQRRLDVQLADMIAGAATMRVILNDPKQTWPHLHAVVVDEEAGQTLGRATARGAGRWILRAWPEADSTRPDTCHLADATLTRSDLIAAVRGR